MPDRTRHLAFGDVAAAWGAAGRARRGRRDRRGGRARARPGAAVPGHLPGVGGAGPAGRAAVEEGVRRLVGDHRRRTGSPRSARRRWTTAGSGTRCTRSDGEPLQEISTRLAARMIELFDLDTSQRGVGHDELRDLHRHHQRPGPDRAARARRNRNAPTCGWSAWGWSSPGTAGSRWSGTPTPATGPTSPSSRR